MKQKVLLAAAMLQLPSLEAIFAQLTQQSDLERGARDLVDVMAG
ncbi:MAG TPA: hypothetical protein VNF74_00750 [Terriglobales bacterium]|nr:hypothetical protein [Terriglobales bacterium]